VKKLKDYKLNFKSSKDNEEPLRDLQQGFKIIERIGAGRVRMQDGSILCLGCNMKVNHAFSTNCGCNDWRGIK
jgi:hypothetical protein